MALEPELPATIEDHYYLTSLNPAKPQGCPEALLTIARRHWEIENCLHHTKDRSLFEDADRNRRGATGMARMRSLAIALLRYVPGDSTPQKQIAVAAKPGSIVRLLRMKRLPPLYAR